MGKQREITLIQALIVGSIVGIIAGLVWIIIDLVNIIIQLQ